MVREKVGDEAIWSKGGEIDMLRFCDRHELRSSVLNIIAAEKGVLFDEAVWRKGNDFFKGNLREQDREFHVFPVLDRAGKIICYGWQDMEANRELRMIRELERGRDVLQFHDIFPDVQEVLVCGCNELAYSFVKYLESQGVVVSVTGRYWEYLGYQDCRYLSLDGRKRMVLYAEDELERTEDLFDVVSGSASDAFECVDQIYEANVVSGKIKDAAGNFAFMIDKLRGKDVYLIGMSMEAQDTYDLLYTYGIDICGFVGGANEWTEAGFFLGKRIISQGQAIALGGDVAFMGCEEQHSTLRSEQADFFDYCGYGRNQQFFLVRDYREIPCSNLIHVLKGKNVFLTGDSRLCTLVKNYLDEVEEGDIEVQCGELSQCRLIDEGDVFCRLEPLSYTDTSKSKKEKNFREELSRMETVVFTRYYSSVRALVAIEEYRNRECEKYSVGQLMPKGILLGAIPSYSGNIFFSGILDGHPDMLEQMHSDLNNNLFLYCIRLAGEKAENIPIVLKEMLVDEIGEIEAVLPAWDSFIRSMERLLLQKEKFTSQELFLIFRIAQDEMMKGSRTSDISQKIIYWEPHHFPREDFPLLAKWLESERLLGLTVVMRRNHLVRTGSIGRMPNGERKNCFLAPMMIPEDWMVQEEPFACRHWQEIKIRFEDLKLHPETELMKLCNRLDIPWSDTLMRVTLLGRSWEWGGTRDFDLKPVFNQYEEYLSEFDRFRISVLSAPYQKRYGYPYVDCRMFSRKELWKMFLKEFRYESQLQYADEKDRIDDCILMRRLFRRQLWNVRTYMVIADIVPEFESIEIGDAARRKIEDEKKKKEMIDDIIRFVRSQEKLVLYGIGRDCRGLLDRLTATEQRKLLFCDKKAVRGECMFCGQKVLAPQELCETYQEYKILITSSMYNIWIFMELKEMGVSSDRITCNTVCLWEDA